MARQEDEPGKNSLQSLKINWEAQRAATSHLKGLGGASTSAGTVNSIGQIAREADVDYRTDICNYGAPKRRGDDNS